MPYKPRLKICQYCKKEFWARRPTTKFCSHSCHSLGRDTYKALRKYWRIKPYILPKLRETEWNYIAGFFDGEGSLSFSGKNPYFAIYNTHKRTIYWIKNKLNLLSFSVCKRKERWKKDYRTGTGKRETIVLLLEKLLPYLKVKKRKAKYMLKKLKK